MTDTNGPGALVRIVTNYPELAAISVRPSPTNADGLSGTTEVGPSGGVCELITHRRHSA